MICMKSSRLNPRLFITAGLMAILALPGCQVEQILEPEPIGQVSKSIGFPVVNRNNQKYILAPQSSIYASDIFDTDGSSMVEISLTDNTVITASYKSHFSLHSHVQHGNSFTTHLTLTRGSLKVATSQLGDLELKTPLAVAQLQGGEMFVSFKSNTLEIILPEGGSVTVRNDHGDVSINSSRYGTTVIAGSAPQNPYELPLSRIERAIDKMTIQ